ncbi:uncharacterized protein [Dysidea avara]|uniref:uncharacterized protein isoform X1 n=1 Tax=Dysidea avara TaxID=196820 RepID=UPI0033284B49
MEYNYETDPYCEETPGVACLENITAGCTHYPTYLDRDSGECVETCPSGTFGVVTGSVDDVSTDRLRVCKPTPNEGHQLIINATQYEFDVDVCAPVGTVLFTMVVSIRDLSIAHNVTVSLQGKRSTIS